MRIRKTNIALVAALAVIAVPPALGAVFTAERPFVAPESVPAVEGAFRIYVADWGYHTAIVIPQVNGWNLGPPDNPAAPFVEYAWGERRFYMESNFWPHAVFAALFLPTASVTYVAGRNGIPDTGPRALYLREISGRQLRALVLELEASIQRDPSGRRLAAYPRAAGYSGRFYPGVGRYLWWMDCNRWTAERLRRAGLASGSRGVVFSGQVKGRLIGFTKVAPL